MRRNAEPKEEQKWSIEKPKLNNARRLRGIYFIDPEDVEFKETIKNARKKLETPVAPAMPCKMSKNSQNWVTRGKSNEIKSRLAFILEASESIRLRMGNSLPNRHEDHIAGKRSNSLHHYNLVHKFVPTSSNENSSSKGSSGQGMGKLEKFSAWNLTKVRSKSKLFDEARTTGAKAHFASLMDTCHLEECRIGDKAPQIQRSSCTPR